MDRDDEILLCVPVCVHTCARLSFNLCSVRLQEEVALVSARPLFSPLALTARVAELLALIGPVPPDAREHADEARAH